MTLILATSLSILLGLIIGSFLSVCIYRIPYGRKEEWLDGQEEDVAESKATEEQPEKKATSEEDRVTICYPARSFCPQCRAQLAWYHNIPVLSWLFLGGKCAFCKAPIPLRYPLVELLSALCALLSFTHYGISLTALVVYGFCCALIVISFIDYDYYIIPNLISLPGLVIGLCLATLNGLYPLFTYPVAAGIKASLLGVLAGGGFLLVVSEGYLRLRKKEGLGMGDVKLLGMTGAFFGPEGSLYTIFVGSVLGSVLGVLFILLSGRKMSHQLPFGPYLALGTVLYLFYGPELVTFAVRVFGGHG